MNKQMLIQAFNYKQWADLRTFDAIGTLDRDTNANSVVFVLQQVNHMVIVEELFKARLLKLQSPHHSTNTEVVPDFNELVERITASDKWFLNFVLELPDERLSETVAFEFVDGQRGSMTLLEILFHIINHGTYHRGAIGHALDLAHVPHPADTYTVFVHVNEPSRRKQT